MSWKKDTKYQICQWMMLQLMMQPKAVCLNVWRMHGFFAIKGHIACVPLDIQAIMGAFGAGAACHAAVEAFASTYDTHMHSRT